MAGSVVDPTGAAIPGATVNTREVSTGKVRTAKADATGQFSLPGVPAGDYEIEVTVAGFRAASEKLTLKVRDRAVLSASLNVGAVTETVVVEAEAIRVGWSAGSFGGGLGGGIIGGIVAPTAW